MTLQSGSSLPSVSDETPRRPQSGPEVSVVIPCLNEADTLPTCLRKAFQALQEASLAGEIVVADNGSTDGSAALAEREGARVVHVADRGYGSALMGGIAAARGRFVVMGDADDSYDFGDVPRLVSRLRAGADLVQGSRFHGPRGMTAGAMPLLHRYVGNPFFSLIARQWFGVRLGDVYCGMRGFTRDLYESLDLRCTGMEFAVEMIVKAAERGARMEEVAVGFGPDGRHAHGPHLRTFRDGWRTLRLFLLYSPRWLFLVPGVALMLAGLAGWVAAALGGLGQGGALGSLLLASLAVTCGYQSVLFAVFTATFAVNEGMQPERPLLRRMYALANLERGLLAGSTAVVVGLAMVAAELTGLHQGRRTLTEVLAWAVPGTTLAALGFQTVLSSFFISMLGLNRR